MDLQIEKYGLSFDIKKCTTSGWALGDENVIGIGSFKPILECKQVDNNKLKNIFKRSKFSKKKKTFFEFWKLGAVYFCTVRTIFQFSKIRGGRWRTTKQFFALIWRKIHACSQDLVAGRCNAPTPGCTSSLFLQDMAPNCVGSQALQLFFFKSVCAPYWKWSTHDPCSSSITSPICQEGQSERTSLIFPLFSRFFLIFKIFSLIFGKFSLSGVALCPPQWLCHCPARLYI